MRKSSLEKLRDAKRGSQKALTTDLEGLFRLLLGGEFNPTQKAFIYDATRLKAYKGPAGCAKTSTICAAGLSRALLQPGSKGLVSRLDYNDLMDTTARRLEEMVERLPKGILIERDKSPPMKWWIRAIPQKNSDGTMNEEPSQITFMGLKESLGSYEFNWAIVDEADEVEEKRVHEINTRLRNKGGDYMVALAFNPPDKHHWLYTACTGRDHQDRKIKDAWLKCFEPQPKENIGNLPPDYYDMLAKSLPEDMKQRLIDGEWGSTFMGAPVYRQFKQNVHVRDGLQFFADSPLIRMWDFGYRHPACIWAQLDWEGRLLVLHEFLGTDMEATAFIRQCKAITAQKFPGARDFLDYGDPAVNQQKDTGKTLALFAREGITIRYVRSKIDFGLQVLRKLFETLVDGEPAIQVERKGCPILISAMRGGYHMDEDGQKPVKDGFYDHLADALRYGVVCLFGGGQRAATMSELPASVAYDPSWDR